jgi:hypothetical protein
MHICVCGEMIPFHVLKRKKKKKKRSCLVLFHESDNLATVVDAYHLRHLAVVGAALLDQRQQLEALQHTAKHHMLAVQVRRGHGGDKELRAVRVLARVGHAQQARSVVPERERLVLELIAVDGRAARAVRSLKVAALDHEARYDAVKVRVAVAEAVQVCAQSAEVLHRLGHHAAEELEDDAARRLLLDRDVKEDARVVRTTRRHQQRNLSAKQ